MAKSIRYLYKLNVIELYKIKRKVILLIFCIYFLPARHQVWIQVCSHIRSYHVFILSFPTGLTRKLCSASMLPELNYLIICMLCIYLYFFVTQKSKETFSSSCCENTSKKDQQTRQMLHRSNCWVLLLNQIKLNLIFHHNFKQVHSHNYITLHRYINFVASYVIICPIYCNVDSIIIWYVRWYQHQQ